MEELSRRNIPTQVVMPGHLRPHPFAAPLPDTVSVFRLPLRKYDPWPWKWKSMIQYLESQAPCIYIPNYDYNFSCVAPKLSKRVAICGIVHSDDPVHYDHFLRLKDYWNGIVAVSDAIF